MTFAKKIQYIKNKKYLTYLNFYVGLLLVFCLPFGNKIIPPIIIVWIITWLIEGNFKNRFSGFKEKRLPFFMITGFFVLHLLSLFITDNLKSGLFDLEIKMTIFIFPFIFLGVNELYYEKRNVLFKAFILGNLITALLCFGLSFYFVYHNYGFENFNDIKIYFLYIRLSHFMHPSYFAMYLVFCLAIIEYLLYNKLIISNMEKISYFFCAAFFIFFIFLLSSRAGVLTLFMLCSVFLIYYIFKAKRLLIKIISLFAIIVLLFMMLFNSRFMMMVNNSSNNISSNEIKNVNKQENGVTDESSNVRLEIWKSAFKICTRNLFLGVGIGDIKDEIKVEYINNNNQVALKNNLNVHNQFLETQLGLGILGLIVLLSLFFEGIRRSYFYKDRLLIIFVFLIGFNFLFESMLNTQAGVIFFSFFYCYLIFVKRKTDSFI